MNDQIIETSLLPEDEDYSKEYKYSYLNILPGPCTITLFWIDMYGGAWLESSDGQRVLIPMEIRSLLAKRIKEGRFR